MRGRPAADQLMRHRQILQCLWDGMTIKQTADRLGLSPLTTSRTVNKLMRARGVDSHVGLVRRALEEGLIR